MADYLYHREQIYGPLRADGTFTWDWLYGQEYALATLYTIAPEERDELRNATEKLGAIFAKTVAVVQNGDDELLLELGLPKAALPAVRLTVLDAAPTLIGRFDFIRTRQGWKLLEFNSDTPGGIVEAFYLNKKVCQYFSAVDPNEGMAGDLTLAFRDILARYQSMGYKTENIVFSALDWHLEDAGTTKYLLRQSKLNAKFVPLKDLRVSGERLYALTENDEQPVDVLYRLHPLGVMADDKDTDGYPTGEHVLKLIAERKLAVINPPGALIAQTKALQALIWGLCEAGEFYTAEEMQLINTYMLPTYFENRFSGRCPYVVKPVLGREGGGVTICDSQDREIARDGDGLYWEQPMVFQEYRDLETAELPTVNGNFSGKIIWSSFLVNGKGSAVGARAGGLITDDLSYFVPVCLAK